MSIFNKEHKGHLFNTVYMRGNINKRLCNKSKTRSGLHLRDGQFYGARAREDRLPTDAPGVKHSPVSLSTHWDMYKFVQRSKEPINLRAHGYCSKLAYIQNWK